MADGEEKQLVDDALGHPIREDLIRKLWHLGEPATATELQRDVPESTLADVNYHLLVLESAGVIELDERESGPTRRAYVIGGDNADDATRRLKLWE
jgi:DNA-binding transcriptional ArsR family regulator